MKKLAFVCRIAAYRIAALLMLALFITPCWAQSFPPEQDWIIEMWTGKDAQYRQIRNNIDQRMARGEDVALIAYNLRKQLRHPLDTKEQFRWAYAAYQTVKHEKDTNPDQTIGDIVLALRNADHMNPPRSYEYSRLRYLAMVRAFPEYMLKPMGERLLKRNPKDYDVMFCQVVVLEPGVNKVDEATSLAYTRTLIKVQPNTPRPYRLLGDVYYKMWLNRVLHHSADEPVVFNKALAAYNKALQVARPNDPFREKVKASIVNIQKLRVFTQKHPQYYKRG